MVLLEMRSHGWLYICIIPVGELAEKVGGGVRPASQNPYPIYGQNQRFPYTIHDPKSSFVYKAAYPCQDYSAKTRPYLRPKRLKTLPFMVAHSYKAHIRDNSPPSLPPPPPHSRCSGIMGM